MWEDGDSVTCSIRDSGPGVEAGKIPRLMEGFSKGDAPPDGELQGSGLGLLLCRRIAERYGGTLGIESQPGQGCAVTFSLQKGAGGNISGKE
jgi:signal transduction histidine kinase